MSPELFESRARAAVGAMIVALLDVLPVGTASHLVNDVVGAYMAGLDDLPPIYIALVERIAADRTYRARDAAYPFEYPEETNAFDRLIVSVARIWVDSLDGKHVGPGALDALRDRVESGCPFVGEIYDRAREKHAASGKRSPLAFGCVYGNRAWTVSFYGSTAETHRMAHATHTNLEVAAALCLRELDRN